MDLSPIEPSPMPQGGQPECVQFRNLWQRRMDGETGPAVHAMEQHKEACPDCAEFHALGESLQSAIRLTPREVPPGGFADRIVSAWKGAAPRRSYGQLVAMAAGFAVAASLFIAL